MLARHSYRMKSRRLFTRIEETVLEMGVVVPRMHVAEDKIDRSRCGAVVLRAR